MFLQTGSCKKQRTENGKLTQNRKLAEKNCNFAVTESKILLKYAYSTEFISLSFETELAEIKFAYQRPLLKFQYLFFVEKQVSIIFRQKRQHMIAESVFKTRNVVCQHVKRKTSSLIPFYSSFSTGVIALWLKSKLC